MFLPLHDANSLKHVKIQYVTLSLIAANVIIWALWSTPTLTSAEAVHAAYVSYGFIPAVINGYQTLPAIYATLPQEASYFTYAFFHSDFMHLIGNMLFIWVFGDNVEDAMGHVRFLIFYLLCAAAGAWAHSLINPQSVAPLIGASGAAAGIIAAYLMLHPRVKIWVLMFGKIPLRISALWVIGAWIAFQVFELVFNSDSEISWGAHVGGIIAGGILVLFTRRSGVELFGRNDEPAPAGVNVKQTPEPGRADDKDDEEPPSPWGRQS